MSYSVDTPRLLRQGRIKPHPKAYSYGYLDNALRKSLVYVPNKFIRARFKGI